MGVDVPPSPFCQPDWRWQLAQQPPGPKRRRRRPTEPHDEWVDYARCYLAAEQGSRSGPPRHLSEAIAAAIREAVGLVHAQDEAVVWRLQAFLLAGETVDAVAGRFGLDALRVTAYQKLFFDVLERLGARGWIYCRAICDEDEGVPTSLPSIWRYFAYKDGVQAAELMIAATTGEPLPDWLRVQDAPNPAAKEKYHRLRCQLLVALMQAQSPQEFAGLMTMWKRLREYDPASTVTPQEQAREALYRSFFTMAGKQSSRRSNESPIQVPKRLKRVLAAQGQGSVFASVISDMRALIHA
jgi:hypothetical protein